MYLLKARLVMEANTADTISNVSPAKIQQNGLLNEDYNYNSIHLDILINVAKVYFSAG